MSMLIRQYSIHVTDEFVCMIDTFLHVLLLPRSVSLVQ